MKDEGTGEQRLNIELFLGGAPLLEMRVCEGLLRFGLRHPGWRFSLRGADFRYSREWLRRQEIAGVLVLVEAAPVAEVLDGAGVPWVSLMPGRVLSHPCVNVDDYRIGRMGAEFFLAKGFMRCAFCGVGTGWSGVRAAGFLDRLAEDGRDCVFIDIPFELDRNWGMSAASEQLLRDWVSGLEPGTGVMAAHDSLANRLVDCCLRSGLRVPRDVAVLGVGNHDLLCRLSPVPISSIDANVTEVAVRGALLLKELVDGRAVSGSVLVGPAAVVERRSTEILAYGDDLVARAVAWIREHACNGIGVADVVRHFPVSQRTLFRRFERHVGHSPAAEIRRARMLRAQEMLACAELSLTAVAHACGYADLSHLDRSFRRELGIGPAEYRRSLRGGTGD